MNPATSPAARSADPQAARQRDGRVLMIGGGLLLGTLGVFVQEAGQDPLTTVWFRCAFGALALLGWAAATGRVGELRLRGRSAWSAALAVGLLVIFNWALFFAAIERSSIAVATVVFHVQPLWLLGLGAVCFGETVSRPKLVAVLFALIGLVLATGLLDGVNLTGLDGRYLAGVLMCLGGSLSYAVVTLIAQRTRSVGSLALAWWQCVVGTLVLLAWPLTEGWPAAGVAWGWLAGLGLLHTGLAYALLYLGMARLPTDRVALLQFVYPAAAIVIDALVYGRWLAPGQLLGVALMAVALRAAAR